MQRSCGRTVTGVLEGRKEVLVAGVEWVRGTGGGESREEIWQEWQGLVGIREDRILPQGRGGGNLESCGQRRDGTYSDAHRHPLVAAAERTDSGDGPRA